MTYELEQVMEIWNNDTGEHLSIGPDRDGLNMIEIRYCSTDGKIKDRLSFTKEQIPLLISALKPFSS